MITKSCGRTNAHAAHDWVPGRYEETLHCEGVGGVSGHYGHVLFTMGADARAGDVVILDQRSGLLVPQGGWQDRRARVQAETAMSFRQAVDYAWDMKADADALASLTGVTFAEAAENLVDISDALAKRYQ